MTLKYVVTSINSLHMTLDRLNSGRYKEGNNSKTAITSAGEKR